MNWKLAVGLGVLALEGLAILYLCLPATAKRVKGIPFIAAGVIGSILGTALVIPPDVFREPGGLLFPFDPNDDAAASFFGPGGPPSRISRSGLRFRCWSWRSSR